VKKSLLIAVVLMAAFVAPAFAYTINDPVNNVWNWSGDHNAYDRIGTPIYELYGMNINRADGKITFDIFTNFPKVGDSDVGAWKTKPADLALDFDHDGDFDYGVAFTDHVGKDGKIIKAGTLYSASQWFISNDYDPNHKPWPQSGAGYVYHEGKIVAIKDGTILSQDNSLTWINNDPTGNLNNDIANWDIRLVLDESDFSGLHLHGDTVDVFYGGATCANDYLQGSYAVTPEPATMLLFGMGVAGLAARLRKRRSI